MALIDNIGNDNQMVLDDFGIAAVFELGCDTLTVTAIWNNAPTRTLTMFDGSVQTIGPTLSFLSTAIEPERGQAVTVAGRLWRVTDVEVDGLGWTHLQLKEA